MGEDEGGAAPPPAVKRRASAGADCESPSYSEPPAKCRRLSDVIHELLAPAQVGSAVKARVLLPEQLPSPSSTAPPSPPDGAEAQPISSRAVHLGEEIDDSL